jgi:pimeloyl-ACP methyl ester carboxylesterase
MFHQAPMSARQFDNVYGPLAKRGIRAVGIDMPGFGLSDVTSFVPKVEDWAKVAPAVLQHLGLRQANVLGHHTGGMVATEIGVQFPKLTRSLVVNGPMPIEAGERVKLLEANKKGEVDFVYQPDGSHLAAAFMSRWKLYGGADGSITGFKADPKLITRYTVERFQGFGPFWYGHHAAFTYDHEKGLRALKVRTLLLTNTTDMIYEHCQAARKMRPDFEYAEIKGGGVDIVDQEPEVWSDLVAKFVHGGGSTG